MSAKTNYGKGLSAMLVCYFIWGFQPLYFYLDPAIDTVFLLAGRIIWAAVFCTVLVAARGDFATLIGLFKDKKVLCREIPAAFLLLADWSIYLFAVCGGRIMECSMGYYILPLVIVALGAIVYREKLRKEHFISIAFIIVGIVLSATGFGSFPLVTLSLAVCFAFYSALKKSLTVDSIVSTTAEILIMVPFALAYIFIFGMGETGMRSVTLLRQLFLVGSGVVTALPMLFFAVGIENLPLSLTGIMQYLSPSLGLVCSLILGEEFSKGKLLSFAFIWLGVAVYAVSELCTNRRKRA